MHCTYPQMYHITSLVRACQCREITSQGASNSITIAQASGPQPFFLDAVGATPSVVAKGRPTSRKTNSASYSRCCTLVICCYLSRPKITTTNNSQKWSSRRLMPRKTIIWMSVHMYKFKFWVGWELFKYVAFDILALNFSHASSHLVNHNKCGFHLLWMKGHWKHPRCERRRDICLGRKGHTK